MPEFSNSQIADFKHKWSRIKKIDPTTNDFKKLENWVNTRDDETLRQLAIASINFISSIAIKRLRENSTIFKFQAWMQYADGTDAGTLQFNISRVASQSEAIGQAIAEMQQHNAQSWQLMFDGAKVASHKADSLEEITTEPVAV